MARHVAHAAGKMLALVGLLLVANACFVDGTPFDPELCPSEIVIEVTPQTAAALTIDFDTLDLSHCTSDPKWSARRSSSAGLLP